MSILYSIIFFFVLLCFINDFKKSLIIYAPFKLVFHNYICLYDDVCEVSLLISKLIVLSGLSDNIIPKDENDFYQIYIDYLLNREAEEKYETRIDELKDMLSIFSCELYNHEDGRSSKDIRDLWTQNGIDRKNARELLNLSVDMKILENNEGKNFKFRNEFYYNYFLSL